MRKMNIDYAEINGLVCEPVMRRQGGGVTDDANHEAILPILSRFLFARLE
jgi:hypothetical protein